MKPVERMGLFIVVLCGLAALWYAIAMIVVAAINLVRIP
jgi:hypothetical protein